MVVIDTVCEGVMTSSLRENLPRVGIIPYRFYDASGFRYSGDPRLFFKCTDRKAKAVEIAELTVQRMGSAPFFDDVAMDEIYSPKRDAPVKKILAYVAGLDADGDILLVDDEINTRTQELRAPARLFLCDLVRYETLKKIDG